MLKASRTDGSERTFLQYVECVDVVLWYNGGDGQGDAVMSSSSPGPALSRWGATPNVATSDDDLLHTKVKQPETFKTNPETIILSLASSV